MIFRGKTPPHWAAAGQLAGSGTPTVSRGMLNIAIAPLVGSMLATIIVSVLKVGSGGRWSVPTMSTLSRPVPFQGIALGTAAGELVAEAEDPDDVGGDVSAAAAAAVPAGVADGPEGPVLPSGLVIAVSVS
ncbi:MAG: hypothetical protein ACHQ01_06205 [Candidatus Limnocylindrales bacterium]